MRHPCVHGVVFGTCLWCLAATLWAESQVCAALWEAAHASRAASEDRDVCE